jgi:hypothetical protein
MSTQDNTPLQTWNHSNVEGLKEEPYSIMKQNLRLAGWQTNQTPTRAAVIGKDGLQ